MCEWASGQADLHVHVHDWIEVRYGTYLLVESRVVLLATFHLSHTQEPSLSQSLILLLIQAVIQAQEGVQMKVQMKECTQHPEGQ